jgi:glycosyltransferase involved in cell wall biosynthesis
MRVTYTAPNRAHHFPYALALHQAGVLHAFVSGVSRFSPRGRLDSIGDKFIRADELQNLFLFAQRLHLPNFISDELAYQAKVHLDHRSKALARESDIFLFYSGAGLATMRSVGKGSVTRVVEAVNSHVRYQENLLRQEHAIAGIPFRGFHRREVARRIAEYEEADRILCPSDFVAESFVSEGIRRECIDIVPYGFSLEPHKADDSVRGEQFRVLYVGQISVRKGLRYLVDAFDKLRHPHKQLLIVGPMARPSGLEGISLPSNVRFAGVLKGEALRAAYRSADAFVLPTIEEGLALVMGEALSNGLPVIATQNSGATNLFTHGREGFIVPIRNSEAITIALQELADDASLRMRMSAAALDRAEKLGGWRDSGKLLVDTLRRSSSPRQENIL